MPVAIGQLSITHLRDGSTSEDQYAANTSLTVAPASGWSSAVPPPQVGSYVWKRSRAAHADGTYGSWGEAVRITGAIGQPGEAGPAGPAGPAGNPGAIGVNTDGSTILVSGFDADGQFGSPTGIIHLGSSRFQLNQASYAVTSSGQGYILASASGAVRFARLVAETEGSASTSRMVWKDFNSGTEIIGDAVIGNFRVESVVVVFAEITPPLGLDQFIRSQFMEILRSSDATEAQLQDMAIALGADRVFQTIVAIDAFIRSLWVSRLESEIYSTDANGYPDTGFHLDGVTGIAKIASLMAKNADIVGIFKSDGFRTLSQVTGTTVPAYAVSSTIFRYSEMCDLIPNEDERQPLSGTIEGFSFTKATRRNNKRVRLHSNGSFSSTITASGGDKDPTIMNRITPIRLFGDNFYVQWHIYYSGNMTYRLLYRTKPGQTGDNVYVDHFYQEDIDPDPDETNYIHPERTAGQLWSGGSGDHAGSYSITAANGRTDITVWVYSGALWGSVTATSNYLHIWTNQVFNGLVLTSGDTSFNVVGFQPDAHYLSSSKSFTIGSTNQDSASVKKYKSGTDFYNRFSSIPVGTNSACSGVVRVDGTSYTVTRLRKDEDRLVFFTGTQEVHVRKFVNGTDTGVYTDLAITTQVVLGAMDGGIESMWIVPWGHAIYDIGQTLKRFRSLYLSGEVVSGSVQTGTVSATSVNATTVNSAGTSNKVYGAVFN
ncbi:MAG: hypothetical protein PHR90_01050 [Sphaerochaetaceae bacterium]|nr:hypothetical protein [Sphaerochaetaceae bacterium]